MEEALDSDLQRLKQGCSKLMITVVGVRNLPDIMSTYCVVSISFVAHTCSFLAPADRSGPTLSKTRVIQVPE